MPSHPDRVRRNYEEAFVGVGDIEWELFEMSLERVRNGLPLDEAYLNNPRRLELIRLKNEAMK